ncbi:MAG TPA: hypothetical protein P5556_09165 [Candidatus Gastranaerophilales bacterium]|nr:hypothetical protein [Candidatus Gastranaerophilales bacterium]
MKKLFISALFLSLLLFQFPILAVNNISRIKAHNFVQLLSNTSKYVKIEGKIYSSEITDDSKVIFLNFGKNYNTSLSAVIYNFDVPAFIEAGIGQPDRYFENKKVVIEGILRISNGKPEIVINSPSQIKVLDK